MYAADLSKIATDDFAQSLLEVELIPSRRVLKDHILDVVVALHERDVHDLEALRRLLRDKRGHGRLAPELGVDAGYLTLLAREVNAYLVKPLALARIEGLQEPELERMAAAGVTSTRDCYERAATTLGRSSLAAETGLPAERLLEVLELCDLLRVTGLGPASAVAFQAIGISSPSDYLATESAVIQARYADWTEEHTGRREVLGLSDIDYCRRYAAVLDEDIER